MAILKTYKKKLSGYLMQAWKQKFTLGQFNSIFILNRGKYILYWVRNKYKAKKSLKANIKLCVPKMLSYDFFDLWVLLNMNVL